RCFRKSALPEVRRHCRTARGVPRRRASAPYLLRTLRTRSAFFLPVKDRAPPEKFLQLVASVQGSSGLYCQLPIANWGESNRQSALSSLIIDCRVPIENQLAI